MAKLERKETSSLLLLSICVLGIYGSFLTWGVLQERISTTPYAPDSAIFRSPLILNTAQSTCAALFAYLYLLIRPPPTPTWRVFASKKLTWNYALVAFCSSLASPFGYASLKHIDYPTLILGKSCKLLPVMALHLTLYRRRFPLHKYLVVALVTSGVLAFTHFSPSRSSSKGASSSSAYGLGLLAVNLLLDGLTNSTQDHIFRENKGLTGAQMMCGMNALSTLLTLTYSGLTHVTHPYLPLISSHLTVLAPYISSSTSASALETGIDFVRTHPTITRDIALFSLCGAIGQLFIFYTLSTFGSLVLVTVTLTRKMLTMLLSVLYFGHSLSGGQWGGVALVFGGVGLEAFVKKIEGRRSLAKTAGTKVEKPKTVFDEATPNDSGVNTPTKTSGSSNTSSGDEIEGQVRKRSLRSRASLAPPETPGRTLRSGKIVPIVEGSVSPRKRSLRSASPMN
ncbi:UDP-galactose transporter [Saitoella coloradoensis]